MLFYTEPSLFALRGRALECLGHVAVAIESTHFARYFETGMKSATQGLALNDESLKEHSFVFIANSAKVMGRAFEMYLGEMVPYLIGVLSESELSVMENVDDEEDDEEYDENADEESDNRRIQLNVQEGFINSKKAALTAIGALAEHTKELFFPYLEKTYEILVAEGIGAIYSLHGLIRAEAYSIMQHIVSLLCISAGIISKPAYGEVVPMNETMSSVTKEIMNCYVECLCMDEDKYPVANACEGLIGVLDKLGVAALQLPNRDNSGPVINELLTSIKLLLNEKAACQKDSQYDAGDEDNEDEDHDYVMMDSLTDLIAALARLLRADYVPCFDEFLKPLMKFTKPTRSSSDRAMAIGCFAEVVAELGPATLKYVDMIVPILKSQLNDGIESVRRNSAFCVGMLVKSTGNSLAPQFMAMLQMLQPLCVRRNIHGGTESTGADVDNALSAVAYMITASRDSIPLAQVLPVMVGALPLTGDTSEGPNIYGCLSNLVLTNNEVALSILPQIVSAMGDCLVPGSSAVDETKAIAQGCIQQMVLSPQLQPLLMNSLSTISNEASRNCLQQLLSAQ